MPSGLSKRQVEDMIAMANKLRCLAVHEYLWSTAIIGGQSVRYTSLRVDHWNDFMERERP